MARGTRAAIACLIASSGMFYAPAARADAPALAHADAPAQATALPTALSLVAADGKPYPVTKLKGRWTWLFFGFTNCPGVCPTTLGAMADAYQGLADRDRVHMAFVSVDPDRDTPAGIGRYVGYFHPVLEGFTADPAVLKTLTQGLGTSYRVSPPSRPGDDYAVGHPDRVFVLDPAGRLVGSYVPRDGRLDDLKNDFNAATGTEAPPPAVPAAGLPATDVAWCGADGTDPLMSRARTLGSGTSVLPAASPMRMLSWRPGDWLWMAHGDVVGGYNLQGGPRGDLTWAAENWQMAMGSRFLGPGILDLQVMTSLEPFTLPPGGTPQLFQTGETYRFNPLVDRQHPHDLLMELASRYTWNLDAETSLFGYGGPAAEPALGPSAFMHRPSSADNHWAPLAHHLQDATHVSYGVATVGARRGAFQLEGSAFNGREPDENRLDIDWGPLDSFAGRLSWFPGANWSLQVSTGRLHEPEVLHPGDIQRTTASVLHSAGTPLGPWSTALLWGQNRELFPLEGVDATLQGYGLESQLDLWNGTHLYGRYELVDKTGIAPDPVASHLIRRIDALTLGAAQDLAVQSLWSLALGADVTVYSMDREVAAAYGGNPVSFRVYLRARPADMPHAPMTGQGMGM